MSRLVKFSLWATAAFQLLFLIYLLIFQILSPTNSQITGSGSTLGLDLALLAICGLFLLYTLLLFVFKIRTEGWRAGLPLVVTVGLMLFTFAIIPALDANLHLRFRLYRSDFAQSATELYPPDANREFALPEQYQHLTVGGTVMPVEGRLFYLQSIGLMAEFGPGYLYDPQNNPDAICTNISPIVENWYKCNLK